MIVRQGFKALLEREGFDVVGEASNGRAAVQQAKELRPDVAVLDLAMPLLNGVDAARKIHQISPRTRTILLTMHTEEPYILAALRAGIRGCMTKTQAAENLVRAIQEISRGAMYLSPDIAHVLETFLATPDLPSDPLTPRERQVLHLIAEGKTTKEIAHLLGVSVKTAESHRTRVMAKLGIHNTAGLVRYAIHRGLI